ncbi:MAG TPA: NnrS family protein [Anaeromyxobacteraceae bacterium]|nr:NnrS family protein [Anaeromyxobacteraceae bacterium]
MPAHPWRREPYRILFPIGAALGVFAVLPFVFRGAGGGSLALFHSIAQIQGFLTCFVVGFLFTFVPRRTGTPPPAGWELAAAVVLPVAAVTGAWLDEGMFPYAAWLALVAIVLTFTLRRLRRGSAREAVPAVFVWVPVSLAAGAAGAVLAAAAPPVASGVPLAWTIGRGLLVQGLVAGLVLGVGGFLVPQLTRGEAATEASDPATRRRALAWHLLAALAFFASFPVESLLDYRLGVGLRAAVASAVLLLVARIHRPPTVRGLHRWLVWLGAWLVPLGFWMGAMVPRLRGAALHVLFVGGFAQLALAVATHVALSHGGREDRLVASPRSLRVMAALLAAAFGGRILAGIDRSHVASWLSVAGMAFTGAVTAWAVLVVPALRLSAPARARERPSREP